MVEISFGAKLAMIIAGAATIAIGFIILILTWVWWGRFTDSVLFFMLFFPIGLLLMLAALIFNTKPSLERARRMGFDQAYSNVQDHRYSDESHKKIYEDTYQEAYRQGYAYGQERLHENMYRNLGPEYEQYHRAYGHQYPPYQGYPPYDQYSQSYQGYPPYDQYSQSYQGYQPYQQYQSYQPYQQYPSYQGYPGYQGYQQYQSY